MFLIRVCDWLRWMRLCIWWYNVGCVQRIWSGLGCEVSHEENFCFTNWVKSAVIRLIQTLLLFCNNPCGIHFRNCWNPTYRTDRLICTGLWLLLKMDKPQPRQPKFTDGFSLWLRQLQISLKAHTVSGTASLSKMDKIFLQESDRVVDQYRRIIAYLAFPFPVHRNSPPNEILK